MSGTDYLLRRKAQLSASEESRRAALDAAAEVHDLLAGLAVAARRHPPQDPRLSGEPAWMVLNGAYLVEQDHAANFADAVRQWGERPQPLRVELTGPWPPYSFVSVDDEDATRNFATQDDQRARP